MKQPTFIILKVGVPFKCDSDDFDRINKELYKNKITYEFIRRKLGLSDSVKLKLNGTFSRELYLIDKNNCLYKKNYRVQTAIWFNRDSKKWQYVSIFPNFIKRYCTPCLNLLEVICFQVSQDELIYRYMDDPKEILSCEDSITMPIKLIEKGCIRLNYPALLNSKYTAIYNAFIPVSKNELTGSKMFPVMYNLILTARNFFGKQQGVLALVNNILTL